MSLNKFLGDWTLALDREGQLWGWGNNEYQQISDELVDRIATPRKIDLSSSVIKIKENQRVTKIAATSTQGFAIARDNDKNGI